jgi:hypothetical protein
VADLESPEHPDELYRYRAPFDSQLRPIMQGDVFEDIAIPGLEDGQGLAMVLTHPCSLRAGATLRQRLLVGRVVSPSDPIALPWRGHFSIMPLPALRPDQPPASWALKFEYIGVVASTQLDSRRRIACLDDFGVALLNQRQTHYFTRYAVESATLHEQSANVLTEAELLESWLMAAIDDSLGDYDDRVIAETIAFDEYIQPRREHLKQPSHRAAIRREVGEEIKRRFG